MSDELQKIFRSYAWDYFSQHSEQRLKAFNFYILVCSVIIGAFVTLASKGKPSPYLSILTISLPLFSFIFWKLDQRTRMLINGAEQALKYLDSVALTYLPDEAKVLAIIEQDSIRTESLSLYPILNGFFSYTRSFNWVYITMTILGLAGTGMCLSK